MEQRQPSNGQCEDVTLHQSRCDECPWIEQRQLRHQSEPLNHDFRLRRPLSISHCCAQQRLQKQSNQQDPGDRGNIQSRGHGCIADNGVLRQAKSEISIHNSPSGVLNSVRPSIDASGMPLAGVVKVWTKKLLLMSNTVSMLLAPKKTTFGAVSHHGQIGRVSTSNSRQRWPERLSLPPPLQ